MGQETKKAVLEARALSAGYGSKVIVDGVDLTVAPGECVGIIGPNGSGKSTLLRALSGVLPAIAGDVLLDGQPVGVLAEEAGMDDLVPQVNRARLVAAEDDHRLPEVGHGAEGTAPASGRVGDHQVGIA